MSDRKSTVETPAGGVPTFAVEEVTGVLEGEELKKARAKRTTAERLDLLETKHDELAKSVVESRIETTKELGKVTGELGTLAGAVNGLKTVVEDLGKREHLTFTAKVEVEKAQQTSIIKVDEAQKLDEIQARAAKRALVAKLVGGGGAIGFAIAKLLGYAGVV